MNLFPSSGGAGGAGTGAGGSKEREAAAVAVPTSPAVSAKERLRVLEEAKGRKEGEKTLSLVVIGHVDAGKSTLLGRLLATLGSLSAKELASNERESAKRGKGSFALAWAMDELEEERERGVTIDISVTSFKTSRRNFTLIDSPGHRDFVPALISGAAMADVAILVVDAAKGAFEKGFEGQGQTREHARLVRALGVRTVVVAVNKLDMVDWAEARFENIKEALLPFLLQTGYGAKEIHFLPVGAMDGQNMESVTEPKLKDWWSKPTLIELLNSLNPPARLLDLPLRLPISNVFRGHTAAASGLMLSGRVECGVLQLGEKLAVLPGDQVGVVRNLEVDGEGKEWAAAGENVTVGLGGVDGDYVSIGAILCPPSSLVPLVTSFKAQIITFDIRAPLLLGTTVELFHYSNELAATIEGLEAIVDKSSGEVIKKNPRMLTKSQSAIVRVSLRQQVGKVLPLETFATNKSMGRILLRRNGETVAAGIVLELM